MKQDLHKEIITVADLVRKNKLRIPEYQRPYKWTVKNVNQLINDIYLHKNKGAYRLGTLIIHDDNGELNIVDGQQRTVTLLLIARAILEKRIISIKNPELSRLLNDLNNTLINPEFSNEISISNILINYSEITRHVATFDEDMIDFFFNKCQFIKFMLIDISEAFQFFDSQNARGKDLEVHDLLKAFHLREFSKEDEQSKTQVVETWESMETKELSNLFGEYLYRIKDWSRGNSARYFTKDNADLFKGINIEKIENYPYTEILRIAHFFIDRYNSSYERNIDLKISKFPFQLDQTIINGRRFFEMIAHYKKVFDTLSERLSNNAQLSEIAILILNTINNYEGKKRSGDTYVRMIFDCALIYYIDKFGFRDISKAVEKIFIWAYSVRMRYQVIQLASIDNYVVYEKNLFKIISNANNPGEVLTVYLNKIEKNRSNKTEKIEELFIRLKYYDK